MKKVIVVALGVALGLGTVFAQPGKTPPPTPGGGSGSGSGSGSAPTGTSEKADTNANLQSGAGVRPWAEGVSPERQKAALDKFREGNTLLNDGLFKQAVDKYREALKSWEHPAIHYNLALALLNLDQPIEVYESLEKAIKYGPDPLEKDKFEHAREYMLLVEKQIAQVDVSCNKIGAKVSIDGKEVFTVTEGGKNRYQGRVRIGKHTFVAEKPGYNAQIDAPFIEPGDVFRIELTLYTAEELTRYKRRWQKTWMPYAVLGGGVALGVFGGVMHMSAKSSYEDFDAAIKKCAEESGSGSCENGTSFTSTRDSGDTKKMIGYIGYGVAGAALVAGGILLYLNRETSYEISADEYRKELRQKGKVSVTPLVTPNSAGAMVYGRF